MATLMRGCASEIVLVNRSRDRSKGMAADMGYGAPLSSVTKIADGEYSDLADAGLIMITVGVNEKAGGATDRNDPLGRLRLLASVIHRALVCAVPDGGFSYRD
jgi:L-lactate dehydrogenase